MAEKKTLLILRLEGALQAWGEMSKWDFRDSADFPTKSGVVGLLGCAMGLERGDPQLAELSNNLRLAVRADRAGLRTVDFQTVTGDPLRTAEGKPKAGGNTIISRRAYLQDACFTVFLDIQDPWRVRIAEALKTPRWPMYLGRKNCVPSRPVWEAETTDYTSMEEAVRLIKRDSRHFAKRQLTWFRREKNVTWINLDDFENETALIDHMEEIIRRTYGL